MKDTDPDKRSALLARLADGDEEEPAFVAPSELDLLSAADVPEHARLSIGTLDKEGVRDVEWDGELSIDTGKSCLLSSRMYRGRAYPSSVQPADRFGFCGDTVLIDISTCTISGAWRCMWALTTVERSRKSAGGASRPS